MIFELFILSAIFTDLSFGDPKWFPHPVRGIGWLCVFFESYYRKMFKNEKIAGVFAFFTVITASGGTTFLLLYLLGELSTTLQVVGAILILYSFIAIKDLLTHSKNVFNFLTPQENIENARMAVGQIVGRDTTNLEREGICRACVETVAENMVDGITAPLFWAITFSLFGFTDPAQAIVFAAIGITLYKAVNTMDSMFGYKNEKYLHFGWFPARFDDIVNLIPSRFSSICIVLGALLSGNDWKSSYRILFRDRLQHTSPNAGYPEAAVAGALNIQLGGTSCYFGKEINKPTLGDKIHSISPDHILRTHKIVLISSALFIAISLLARIAFVVLIAG